MTTEIKTEYCTNCNYTTTDATEFKFHPCKQGANRSDYAIYRAQVKEAKAEARRDEVEDKILKIIGETIEESLTSPRFNQLRALFAEWESADVELGEATEKILRLERE
jgi:hypothetical protein